VLNYAFIDGQNLHKGIQELGWNLDYRRFRTYLKDKYAVEKAFIVMGYVATNTDLYTALQSYGYTLIFKPILTYKDGRVKGNCDADLVLNVMTRIEEFAQAVIVSGDGDFFCLIKYLKDRNKLRMILVPDENNYSALLKPFAAGWLASINAKRKKLEYMKTPRKDGTIRSAFRGDTNT
jgi:uncharacterized LabA/DUF88 family protein